MDSKMKIIITGHTSPMGSAVYDYYKQKHEVLGVSKNEIHRIEKGNEKSNSKKNRAK